MTTHRRYNLILMLGLVLLTGCATFRSDLNGAYQGEVKRNLGSPQVSALFIFTHVHQTLGYDAIPKVVGKKSMIQSFDDVFHDALGEFSNLRKYDTFTEEAGDVNHPERRSLRDSLTTQNDYTVKIRIIEERHFAPTFFAGFGSVISATVLPMPYRQTYRMETEVYSRGGSLVGSYHRQAYLSKWVELLLVFAYPFCPEDRKREEVFMLMLHDTFKQIESENVLKPL
ncbi:MAG: hypothetical protein NTW14_00440 [bacterium]|nr:hypothetical protein [bacterium]